MMNGQGFVRPRMKRKDLVDTNDQFNLYSPAPKIRRLETLPKVLPIIEEPDDEEGATPLDFQFQNLNSTNSYNGGLRIEELPSDYVQEEASVRLKPVNNAASASGFSVSVDPHLFSGFTNNEFCSSQLSSWRPFKDEGNTAESKGCLAVVPWVPLKTPSVAPRDHIISHGFGEGGVRNDDEEMEEAAMDIEDNMSFDKKGVSRAGVESLNQGLNQWQQQQCKLPQPPNGASTPVFWHQ